MKKIEILAPAGGFDSIISAVRSGADAVYVGEKSFSARASAQNFDKDELKKDLSNKVLKDLDYIIPASAKLLDVKHNYNVKNNMLEYTITVTTSENIAQIDMLTKSQAQQIIREQNVSDDGSEVVPSNPQKRPINDIRNELEHNNSIKEDTKEKNTN